MPLELEVRHCDLARQRQERINAEVNASTVVWGAWGAQEEAYHYEQQRQDLLEETPHREART
jgi:hypothetical protein